MDQTITETGTKFTSRQMANIYVTWSLVLLRPHHSSVGPDCINKSIKLRICRFLQFKSVAQEHQRKHFPQIERI